MSGRGPVAAVPGSGRSACESPAGCCTRHAGVPPRRQGTFGKKGALEGLQRAAWSWRRRAVRISASATLSASGCPGSMSRAARSTRVPIVASEPGTGLRQPGGFGGAQGPPQPGRVRRVERVGGVTGGQGVVDRFAGTGRRTGAWFRPARWRAARRGGRRGRGLRRCIAVADSSASCRRVMSVSTAMASRSSGAASSPRAALD